MARLSVLLCHYFVIILLSTNDSSAIGCHSSKPENITLWTPSRAPCLPLQVVMLNIGAIRESYVIRVCVCVCVCVCISLLYVS